MHRSTRVAGEMQKEVSQLLREMKDPRLSGLVSIVDVELSRDLSSAKIRVSVFGDEAQQNDSIEALERATGFIRGELARRLRLRVAPEIKFILDRSMEYSQKINHMLQEIQNDGQRRD